MGSDANHGQDLRPRKVHLLKTISYYIEMFYDLNERRSSGIGIGVAIGIHGNVIE
jgi:hypothetical protein